MVILACGISLLFLQGQSKDCIDADQDGYFVPTCGSQCGPIDCNDSDASVYPGAEELCDGLDNDCNSIIDDRDMDADAYIDEACGGQDCDDANPDVNPAAEENPVWDPSCSDGLDNDCDGLIDMEEPDCRCWDFDDDGYDDIECGGYDCDDSDPFVNPGATEGPFGDPTCSDGIDNDCDWCLSPRYFPGKSHFSIPV